MTRREKLTEIGEIIFKLMFLTVGFLQYSRLTFGNPVISWIQWPMLALGGVLLALRVKDWKEYAATKGFWLLILFALSYLISSVVNIGYGWYDNLRFLAFLGLEITLLYSYSKASPDETSRRHTEICMWYYISLTFLLSLLSFVFLFLGVKAIFEQDFGPTYNIGFWWGRLFGAYWDPNIAAVMAVICCAFCLCLFIKHKHWLIRTYLVLNVLLQLVYIEFSDSRAGKVCLIIATAVLGFMYALRLLSVKKAVLRVTLSLAVAVVVTALVLGVVALSGEVYNNTVAEMEETVGEEVYLEPIGREGDIAQDVSNRRFDIWGSALELFRSSAVVGVSHGNIVAYAEENLPDTYIINNDHMVFNTMHNVLVDILASQGIIGLGLFLAAAIVIAVGILKKMPRYFASKHFYTYAALFSVVLTALVSSMFMTEIVYVISPLTLIFWVSAGCLSHAESN